jgi:hypothetical protein
MRIIVMIMLAVLALDLVGAIYLLRSWIAAVALLLVLGVMYVVRPTKKAVVRAVGWHLGTALEISDPHRPTRVADACISPRILNLGMLLIGAPGSGKTIAALSFLRGIRDHSPGCGWASFEGKGDIDIYKKCVAMGDKPDYFFSSELPGSDTINLFEGQANDVIDRMSKVLIGETTSTSFYMDEQKAVLTRIIPLLRGLPVATNLRDLYVVLSDEYAGKELLRRAAQAGADTVDIELARAWFDKPISERIKNISGLLNRLFIFVYGAHTDRLNAYQPDIVISNVVAEKKKIYFHMPLTAFSRDVAVAIVETFGVEARKRQLAGTEDLPMFYQMFDDWGAFFHEGFKPYSARCRSAGMPLNFGFQSRAQLNAVDPNFADELDDTIASKIILCVQGESTAKYAIHLLGEYEGADASTSDSGDGSTNMRSTQEDRITPRKLRELQAGEAYVSTSVLHEDHKENPLWMLRVPMPEFDGWQDVPMPPARTHSQGDGLNFWNRFMNPSKLAEIREEAVYTQQNRENEFVARNEEVIVNTKASLRRNPGLHVRTSG